jgi:hypothetical protein
MFSDHGTPIVRLISVSATLTAMERVPERGLYGTLSCSFWLAIRMVTVMRKICLFATHHEFQEDSPMDSAFDGRLRELARDHQVDCILEEATGLPAKSCVELLADELGIRWANVDLTVDQRKLVPDSALTGKYDTLQDLTLHSHRESLWVANVSAMVVSSGLLIVGLCHVLSMGEKLRTLDFSVEVHVYDPPRIYNWSGRPRVAPAQTTPKSG